MFVRNSKTTGIQVYKMEPLPATVPWMTFTEVRRSLDEVRTRWRERSYEKVFCIEDDLHYGINIQDFCFAFIVGQQKKRKEKRNRSKGAGITT